ncbi:MAG: putative quinol monooxygenase [Gammaproteobacteria bacterium]
MIELHLLIHLPRRQKRSLLDAFQSLARWARAEHGCLSVELFVAAADSRSLRYVETWKSEADLRQMIQSPHFSKLIALMELASEAPACEFRIIKETYGLELAEQMRFEPGERKASDAGLTLLPNGNAPLRLP